MALRMYQEQEKKYESDLRQLTIDYFENRHKLDEKIRANKDSSELLRQSRELDRRFESDKNQFSMGGASYHRRRRSLINEKIAIMLGAPPRTPNQDLIEEIALEFCYLENISEALTESSAWRHDATEFREALDAIKDKCKLVDSKRRGTREDGIMRKIEYFILQAESVHSKIDQESWDNDTSYTLSHPRKLMEHSFFYPWSSADDSLVLEGTKSKSVAAAAASPNVSSAPTSIFHRNTPGTNYQRIADGKKPTEEDLFEAVRTSNVKRV